MCDATIRVLSGDASGSMKVACQIDQGYHVNHSWESPYNQVGGGLVLMGEARGAVVQITWQSKLDDQPTFFDNQEPAMEPLQYFKALPDPVESPTPLFDRFVANMAPDKRAQLEELFAAKRATKVTDDSERYLLPSTGQYLEIRKGQKDGHSGIHFEIGEDVS